jgi:prostamide/prostaglandin F2alpha synthase
MPSRKWIRAIRKALSMKITGDVRGDGFQNGGALVVDRGGNLLFEYVQEDATEHISTEDILKALKLDKK